MGSKARSRLGIVARVDCAKVTGLAHKPR